MGSIRYDVAVVPPGGGETDYSFVVEQADRVPAVGEYLLHLGESSANDTGLSAFRVLYVTTAANHTSEGHAVHDSILVQVEPISHPHQSRSHASLVEMYTGRSKSRPGGGKNPEAYPESGY